MVEWNEKTVLPECREDSGADVPKKAISIKVRRSILST
jgi:hypothetical protein